MCGSSRPRCFSCGRRGICHRRSCATRQPGYNRAAQPQPQPVTANTTTYGTVAARGAEEQPPHYDDVTEKGNTGLAGFLRGADGETRKALE